jgi:PAS domain S-box-containing protein
MDRTPAIPSEPTANAATPPPPTGGRPCLVVTAAPRPSVIGSVLPLGPDEVVLGRAEEADYRIDDPGVSRRHARIVPHPEGGHLLADLGSRNGTYLNGIRVRSARLSAGDRIQVGTITSFRYALDEGLALGEAGRLRQALAAGGVGTFEWDARTGEVRLSEEGMRLLAVPDEGGPAALWRLVSAEDRPGLEEALRAVLASGEDLRAEVRVILAGRERWIALQGQRFLDGAGEPARVAGTIQDATDRRHTEQELRRQALMFESLSDGLVVLDLAGTAVDWNPAAESIYGHGRAQALGRRLDELLGAAEGEGFTRALLEAVRHYGRWSAEVSLRHREGAAREVELVAMPLADADGHALGVVTLHRDVGERRKVQERLRLAERLTSLGTLASGMAHEINNPLAYVLGNVDYAAGQLEAEPGPARMAEVRNALAEARLGAERIRTLVRDLRFLSHGGAWDERAPVDLNAAVEFACRVTSTRVRHRARLVKELGEIPVVPGSEARLGQVVINLLVNAVQAIPEGSPAGHEIRVVTRLDAAAGRVRLEVSDTGCGMTPEVRARAFDPFFTTKPAGEGTGLGLSVCHAFVASAGGQIAIESEPGRGTTVRVLLPAGAAAAAPAPGRPEEASRPARVLVVDDDALVGSALKRLLSPRHEVVTCPSAAEALQLLGGGARYDAILCDVMMPEMDGTTFHAQLARIAPDQAERVVFMTGGAFERRIRAALEALPNRKIPKPCPREELERVVAEVAAAGGGAARIVSVA